MNDLEKPDRDDTKQDRYIVWLAESRNWIALTAIVVAVIGLAANYAGVTISLYSGDLVAETSPLTVVSIVVLASSIVISERRDRTVHYAALAAMIAIAVSVLPHLGEFVGLGDLQIEALGGRVGVATALIISLLSMSVVLRFYSPFLGLACGLSGTAFVLNGIIEQSYGLPYFDGEMAFLTLVSLAIVMAAIATLYLHRPLIRVIFLSGPIGFRTRLMMAVGFLAPWFCGLLLYRWYGVPDREFHVEANLISTIIWVMLTVTLASGYLHEKADKKRRAAEQLLAKQATTDSLTGLPNRSALVAQFSASWERYQRHNVSSAIILIDLDEFKNINDTFGHDVGDIVLKAVRGALLPCLRQEDMIGRWGGEEFICLVRNTDLIQLQHISERLRTALVGISDLPALSHGKGPIPVSGSFGVSTFTKGDRGYEAAIKRADDALYIAKRNGRNRVVFDTSLRPSIVVSPRRRSALTA